MLIAQTLGFTVFCLSFAFAQGKSDEQAKGEEFELPPLSMAAPQAALRNSLGPAGAGAYAAKGVFVKTMRGDFGELEVYAAVPQELAPDGAPFLEVLPLEQHRDSSCDKIPGSDGKRYCRYCGSNGDGAPETCNPVFVGENERCESDERDGPTFSDPYTCGEVTSICVSRFRVVLDAVIRVFRKGEGNPAWEGAVPAEFTVATRKVAYGKPLDSCPRELYFSEPGNWPHTYISEPRTIALHSYGPGGSIKMRLDFIMDQTDKRAAVADNGMVTLTPLKEPLIRVRDFKWVADGAMRGRIVGAVEEESNRR